MTEKESPARSAEPIAATGAADSRRWIALAFIAVAQLMIALDATVTNIALPSAQADLGFSDEHRQWVIIAYTLAFGGLLLLGGRLADHLGRARALPVGLLGFAAASMLGGFATNFGVLVAARGLQGAFAALLAPTVLSLIATTFTEPKERSKAFAIFGAIAGSGGALGLVLGGVLAEDLTWRACMYVNAPIAVVAAVGVRYVLGGSGPTRRTRLDLPGGLLAIGGMTSIVFGCTQNTVLLGVGLVLLAAFAVWEARVPEPLLPLRILRSRNRVGAYLAVAFSVAGMLGMFLFLTYYLQTVLGYLPVQAGLAFLPLSAAVLASSQLAARLQAHLPPRALIASGLLVAAAALGLLTGLSSTGAYATDVLPAEILLGLGMGCVFPSAMSVATQQVNPRDAGVAAAVVNTAQQVGGSIGVAVLNAIATGVAAVAHADALVAGYTAAAFWAALAFATGALVTAVLINAKAPKRQQGRLSK
ncbi:MFS transporter [Saccharopolyspora phatthalungensis]|uniref:EmrB/QacA subfamily drug resistance transporter n=1 Tax=Saccharopolyspora phatthalungensis TaxID=664693 RepID=A0A840Q3Y7_9PSEU|nr:MFS transporter [Saccharopolyspora phatthalungensis]MBB5157212.1 EmrB/QacA subfamily drug resistance transporter [Saccharopolyspora phatthalungensis]